MTEHLRAHFRDILGLPESAIAWLLDLWRVIQAFDDFADGDAVERSDLDTVIWAALVGMPCNAFFAANSQALLPVMATQVLKWQASDQAERAGNADAKSYMWRAGYYDVVLIVTQLCRGHDFARDAASTAMSLYGETYEDYMKEFTDA